MLFFDIIPTDRPRLNLKFYTRIFEYFIVETKNYGAFLTCLKKYPPYLINQDHLLDIMKKQLDESQSLKDQPDTIEIHYRLHDLNRDY
jgi:hypothetical protein